MDDSVVPVSPMVLTHLIVQMMSTAARRWLHSCHWAIHGVAQRPGHRPGSSTGARTPQQRDRDHWGDVAPQEEWMAKSSFDGCP
jgi:hypothetical protein